ncbi:MAG: WG repeat-containing protein [Candidatus Pseudobacter hemicellulosilyticus]|uniref:WG repeat-containing protein n=1 Tax=Candidatus Pseudobacter hemicellulosilyticus TaxID=3121375 RepID=A0AAJ5WWV1_9BACT|nr:MAG: WG repeat-containing protein [Pseudobacter sp.]
MKTGLLLFLLIAMADSLFPQAPATYLAKASLKNKFGCIDPQGNEVIQIIYNDIGNWGNNRIAVNKGSRIINHQRQGGQWGFCNEKGELVIAITYDEVQTFSEGMAAVKRNNKWGFIDSAGNLLIPFQFDYAGLFREGHCIVANNEKYGFIDRVGKIAIPLTFDDLNDFNGGVASAFIGQRGATEWEEKKGFYCLIDSNGQWLTNENYLSIADFHDGLARVEIANAENSDNNKFGFINRNGILVVPATYDGAGNFCEGMAVIAYRHGPKHNILLTYHTYGYINREGKEIIPAKYIRADNFSGGKAVVGLIKKGEEPYTQKTQGNLTFIDEENQPQYGLIDKEGRYILAPDWALLAVIDNDLLLAQRDRLLGKGVITIKGETRVPLRYSNIEYAGNNILVADNGASKRTTFIMDIHNRGLLTIDHNTSVMRYELGMLHIRTDNNRKSGFINLKGQLVIPAKYDRIYRFEPTAPEGSRLYNVPLFIPATRSVFDQ